MRRTALLGVCALVLSSGAALTRADTVWNSIAGYVNPSNPREGKTVTIRANGVWPDSCVPVSSQVGVQPGNVVRIDFYDDPLAYPYCYGQATSFGGQNSRVLAAGHYDLYAAIFTNVAWFPDDPPEWVQTHTEYLLSFTVFFVGDINVDGAVNSLDLSVMASSWGKRLGEGGYVPGCDLTGDNCVDVVDLLTLAGNWGKAI